MRPIVVGNSHIACVLRAAADANFDVDAVAFKLARNLEDLDRIPVDFNELTREASKTIAGGGPVFSFFGAHRALGLRRHPEPFDFVLATEPDLPLEPDAALVPLGAMRAVIVAQLTRNMEALERVVELARGPVYQFEAPPPPNQSYLEGRREFSAWAGPLLRYKLWRLHSEIAREHAERCGARFVEHPPEAVDDEGFLRTELCADMMHANDQYGALVLRQIEALIASG
jgi:hypothetical protein